MCLSAVLLVPAEIEFVVGLYSQSAFYKSCDMFQGLASNTGGDDGDVHVQRWKAASVLVMQESRK